MAWYEDWFDRDEYEMVYQQRDVAEAERAIDLLVRTARPAPGAAILDMGCGRGRHARSLARRGYRVTGVDLSPRALDQARRRAVEEGLDITFQQGDMRTPVCDACFDGVASLFTAFGYFDDEGDHLRTVEAYAHNLRAGGWLFQDFLNAPYVESTLVPETHSEVGGVAITQRRWIEGGRINKTITLRRNGDEHHFQESVRLLTLDDLRALYDAASLDLQHTFGDYHGAPYGPDTPRLILYATRR